MPVKSDANDCSAGAGWRTCSLRAPPPEADQAVPSGAAARRALLRAGRGLVQRSNEVEPLVERIDHHQDRVAIFESDVLDARQRAQHAGNVARWQFTQRAPRTTTVRLGMPALNEQG